MIRKLLKFLLICLRGFPSMPCVSFRTLVCRVLDPIQLPFFALIRHRKKYVC